MKKKVFALFISVIMIASCFEAAVCQAAAQSFVIGLQTPITNGYVNTTDLEFKISGRQDYDAQREYTLKFEYQGKTDTDSMLCRSGVTQTKNVTVNVKQGDCSITASVVYNGQVVSSKSFSFKVIRQYRPQFMEGISKHGINGVDKSNSEYFKLMGLQSAREGYEWGWTETQKGIYNWPSVHRDVLDAGANLVFLACYGNSLYNGGRADKTGPTTKEEIDAFAKYTVEAAKRYPEIKYFEIWNEPNIQFWQPKPNLYDYINLLEVTNAELKRIRENSVVMGGAMAVSDYNFTGRMYDMNAAANMDALSVHPYCYPSSADIYIQDMLNNFDREALKRGGWQIRTSTEYGWATNTGYRGVSDEFQATELIKHFAIADYTDYEIDQIYRMNDLAINGAHDESFNEDNFGVINYDKTPKPAVLAIKTMNEMTNGGIPFGVMEVPYGVSAYLYLKDGEGVAMIWRNARTNGATPAQITFTDNVSAYDMNGNPINCGNTVPISTEPVYVKGISKNTLARSLNYNIKRKLNIETELVSSFADVQGYNEAKALLLRAADAINLSGIPNETDALDLVDTYYNETIGKLVEMYRNGTFKGSEEQLAAMMYIAHLGGTRLIDLYMASVTSTAESTVYTIAESKAENTYNLIERKACGGTLANTQRIYKFAKEALEKLQMIKSETLDSPMKNGMIKGYAKMTEKLCDTVELMANIEHITHNNILVQMPSTELGFTVGKEKTANVSLYNYKNETLTGRVEIVDPAGGVVGISQNITLASGNSMTVPVTVLFRKGFDEGEMSSVRFVKGNSVLKTVPVPIELLGTATDGGFGTYTAQDFDALAEEHIYQWMYSYDDKTYYPMQFANSKAYTLSTTDKNRYIACEVTPVYSNGVKGAPQLQRKGQLTQMSTVGVSDISSAKRYETANTPSEYKFKLAGTSREYSLLDVFEGEKASRYFVLSDFLTGNIPQHNTDPQNINPNDANSVGYWLNTTYVNDGYSLAGVNWPKLEEDMYRYADKTHKWWVEAGITGIDDENTAKGYSYTAGVGLLTETESIKYLGRYGWNVKTENGAWYNPWMIATGSAATNKYIQVVNFGFQSLADIKHSGTHILNDLTPGRDYGELYPRPALYLGDEFFKNVKLDVASLGSEVKKIIVENYTKGELSGIYTDSELREIGFVNKLGLKRYEKDENSCRIKVDILKNSKTIAAAYDEAGNMTEMKICGADGNVEFGPNTVNIKVFAWNSLEAMRPLSKAVEFKGNVTWR